MAYQFGILVCIVAVTEADRTGEATYRAGNTRKLAKVRVTLYFGRAKFQLKHYVEGEGGRLILLDEYKFVRPVRSN